MGKLIEKLHHIGQGPSGSLGFMPRRDNSGSPRPAAILVTLRAQDVAAAEAAIKAEVDAIIITGWKPGVDLGGIKSALASGQALWGVHYDGAGAGEPLKAAREAGAGFFVLGESAAVSALFEEANQFDRVVTIAAPQNDLEFLTLRAINTLPAQAALLELPAGVAEIAMLPASAFAKLAIIAESVRFPVFASVNDVPDLRACQALVRLGIDGVVLSGVGVEVARLGEQVTTVRKQLEQIPPLAGRDGVNLGSLLGAPAVSKAAPEPDEE